jgi:hypothetical protein
MGEKGAEVAPAPTLPVSSEDQARAAAAIASILNGGLGVVTSPGSTATAQPMGELGSELSSALPDGISPTIPNLTSGSGPTIDAGNLGGLTPTVGAETSGLQPPVSEPLT